MSLDKVISQIEFEISEIELEVNSYKALIDLCKLKNPNLIEMTAVAGFLHSFYNGIERIFIIVAKNIDMELPSGKNWHNKL